MADRLARRLDLGDAVRVGMGAMIGAGIFAAPAPAAEAAGSLLLAGLLIAGLVAYANATSSAQLAALYPESGGTYVYAGKRLGHYWGFLAGWGFVVGKTASLAAMALTLGFYAYGPLARPLAVAAVVIATAINYLGVEKTAKTTRLLLVFVLAALAVVVVGALGGGSASLTRIDAHAPQGVPGILRSGGLLFFAFAGYARIATLGEEVKDPKTTIPRAIPIALGIVVVIYAVVLAAALLAIGPQTIARSTAPLATVLQESRWDELAPLARIGAAVASAGVLLSLLAGVSRTAFSMARNADLPRYLAAVHVRYRTPHRAEVVAGIAVAILVSVADLRGAIGFSSFAVLAYYALANASAATLSETERLKPRSLAAFGIVGCTVLALALPLASVVGGIAVLGAGSLYWFIRRRPND